MTHYFKIAGFLRELLAKDLTAPNEELQREIDEFLVEHTFLGLAKNHGDFLSAPLIRNGNFAEVYRSVGFDINNPADCEKLCLVELPEEVNRDGEEMQKILLEKYSDIISNDYSLFIPFKQKVLGIDRYFVAYASLNSAGVLYWDVLSLAMDCRWIVEDGYRFLLPPTVSLPLELEIK